MFATLVHIVCTIMVPIPLDPIKESPHPHEDGGFFLPYFLIRLKKSSLFAKKNLGVTKEPPTFAPEPVG